MNFYLTSHIRARMENFRFVFIYGSFYFSTTIKIVAAARWSLPILADAGKATTPKPSTTKSNIIFVGSRTTAMRRGEQRIVCAVI